jgi:hypothetical protein
MQYASHAFKHPAEQHYSLSSLLLLLQEVGKPIDMEISTGQYAKPFGFEYTVD